MFLWLGCFVAAAVAIGMVQGLFVWMLLALRYWWVILACIIMYWLYQGAAIAFVYVTTIPRIGHYTVIAISAMIGLVIRSYWDARKTRQTQTPPRVS
jgi:hypothetical protein